MWEHMDGCTVMNLEGRETHGGKTELVGFDSGSCNCGPEICDELKFLVFSGMFFCVLPAFRLQRYQSLCQCKAFQQLFLFLLTAHFMLK